HREPFRAVRQYHRLPEIEFCIVTQPRGLKRYGIAIAKNGEFSAVQLGGSLARAVCNLHRKLRRTIIKHRENQCRARLRPRIDVVRKVAPNDLAGGGLFPPNHAVWLSNNLDRTERFAPFGACLRIWRSCAAVSGPSSASY